MTSVNSNFNLGALYDQASDLTHLAARALEEGNGAAAFEALTSRALLVRVIQRQASGAQAWGSCDSTDAAALRYLAADRKLEAFVERRL